MNKKNFENIIYTDKTEFSVFFSKILGIENVKAKTVTFVVTEDCTLRCSYCYERHKNSNNRLSIDQAKKFIDLLFKDDLGNKIFIKENDAEAIILEFIGGEPLLEIELIDQICEYFLRKAIKLNHRWQSNFMISMISNGTEYFSPAVQDFIKKYKNRLSLSITIDGNKALHDACRRTIDGKPNFDIAEKAYKDVLNKHLTVSTKMTIAPSNLKFLSEALKNLSNYEGVRNIPANPIFEEEWTIEQAAEYYNQLKDFANYVLEKELYKRMSFTFFTLLIGASLTKDENANWCGGTGKMLTCSTNGEIYPCLRYIPFTLQNKDKREKLLLGDVEHGFLYNEKQKNTFEELEKITLKSQSTEECINCPIARGCAWCSGWNYDYYGTPNKRFTGICNMHKARVLANVYYWNTLYRKYEVQERFPMNVPKDWALEIISEDEYNMLVELAKEDY